MGQKLGGIQEEYGFMWKEGLENRLEPNDEELKPWLRNTVLPWRQPGAPA